MGELRPSLERLLETGGRAIAPLGSDRIAIYGAGNCGQKVSRLVQENGIAVAAFIDRRGADGNAADGIPRLAPESSGARDLAASGVPIVIGIFNFATDVAPIVQLLRELGFTRIVPYPEFHELYGEAD